MELEIGKYYYITDSSCGEHWFMLGKVTGKNGTDRITNLVKIHDYDDDFSKRCMATFICREKFYHFNISANTPLKLCINKCWAYKDTFNRKWREATDFEVYWLNKCIEKDNVIEKEDLIRLRRDYQLELVLNLEMTSDESF